MLQIETFRNADLSQGWRPGNNAGGATLFKALGHPLAARKGSALVEQLKAHGPVALYDPSGAIGNVHAYYDLSALDIAGYFVQRVEDLGATFLGHPAQPLTEIGRSKGQAVFALLFDANKTLAPLRHVFPRGAEIVTLDALRLPDDMLTNRSAYLDPLNFATNFALFRDLGDASGLHTRVAGVNYWALPNSSDAVLWLCLFGADGQVLAEWREPLPPAGAPFVIDSRAVRARFGLSDFTGSLFIHALHGARHDVVKYALDVDGEEGLALSCSHDANAWPADFYAGMPAGEDDERVTLYIQNSHPTPIPPDSVGVNVVGSNESVWLAEAIPGFATRTVDVSAMLPGARFPDQLEITAGRHFVRPRYEVIRTRNGTRRRRLAHANVERTDLKPDPRIPQLAKTLGKGYIMPLPVLPQHAFSTVVLPTPMARDEHEMPLRVELYDASGTRVAEKYLGRVQRRESVAINIETWLAETGARLPSGYGHVEFLYDFRGGGDANGWLHALARFEQKASGHRAETIFGAHIYNVPVIYKDEPQSYTNAPPGLSTRLFLRLGQPGQDTLCHLLYPASLPWHPKSATELVLQDSLGQTIATRTVEIPCGGSLHWRLSEMFSKQERAQLNGQGYVTVRDTTCRLFGFHGLVNGDTSFCLDHMFGF